MKVKIPNDRLKKKGAVYRIPCKHCNKVYIGETGRTVQKRLRSTRPRSEGEIGIMELLCMHGTRNKKRTGRRWRLSPRRDTFGEGRF